MDLVGLATSPTAALGLSLSMLGLAVLAIKTLWKKLGERDAEIKQLYELNRNLCSALLPLAGRGALVAPAPSERGTAEHTPGGGHQPHPGCNSGPGSLDQ